VDKLIPLTNIRPIAAVTTTTTLKQALILVEHDGLSLAILDHALSD
jgi:hypothetical protein